MYEKWVILLNLSQVSRIWAMKVPGFDLPESNDNYLPASLTRSQHHMSVSFMTEEKQGRGRNKECFQFGEVLRVKSIIISRLRARIRAVLLHASQQWISRGTHTQRTHTEIRRCTLCPEFETPVHLTLSLYIFFVSFSFWFYWVVDGIRLKEREEFGKTFSMFLGYFTLSLWETYINMSRDEDVAISI